MRHWSQLAIRNWRVRPGRAALATIAIALGVGVVVWVTGAYESIRESIADQVWSWIGQSHLAVESKWGEQGTVYASIIDDVRKLPNVAHVTGIRRETIYARVPAPDEGPATSTSRASSEPVAVEAIGIMPESEYAFRNYHRALVAGRLLTPDDRGAAIVERGFAADHGLKLGDTIELQRDLLSPPHAFAIVGLIERRRIARFQPPMVRITLPELEEIEPRDRIPRVTKVEIILRDASRSALSRTTTAVRRVVNNYNQGFLVTTAEAKLNQVDAATRQTNFVLTLISGVALFTAFFIILSTLSMGMIERIAQLGLLRCIGMTRAQVAATLLAEVIPIGVVGLALGVPVGMGLIALSVMIVPEYIGHFAVSPWGIGLALVGGAITTLLGGILPAIQATRVHPLEATRPQARPPRPWLDIVAAVLGAAMITTDVILLDRLRPSLWLLRPELALTGVMLLYGGFALLAPALIRFAGVLFVRGAATMLALRPRLLADQVGRASWRSAGICSGLMVGLSLIVCLIVHTESLVAGWDFPKRIAEAFIYSAEPDETIPPDLAKKAASIGGVASYTTANDFPCKITGINGRFAAGDVNDFFSVCQLEFVRGTTQEEAIAKLRQGGYILVTPEFADLRHLTLDSPVVIQSGTWSHVFRVAGFVKSPAIEIAAAYFNADSQLMGAVVQGVIGTLADAKRYLGESDHVRLYLLNFDLPDTSPPAMFHERELPSLVRPADLMRWTDNWGERLPERRVEWPAIVNAWHELGDRAARVRWASLPDSLHDLGIVRTALTASDDDWASRSPAQRWRAFREELVMLLVADRANVPRAFRKSVVELKAEIDRTLRTATYLMTAIPMVALIVAALGVANLMMANVSSRARQLAILRAVGATKLQITRLVIGEALVLGAIGSVLGLALGLVSAHGVNELTHRIWGFPVAFAVPRTFVGLSIVLTVGVCLVAGILPARRAARSNVIEAMQMG